MGKQLLAQAQLYEQLVWQ